MDKNEIDPAKMNFGDLGVIRNILMGQQINQYDTQFADIAQKHQDLQQNIDELSRSTMETIQQMEDAVNHRFDKIESMLAEQVELLKDNIDAQSRADKHQIGKLLQKMSQQLLKE